MTMSEKTQTILKNNGLSPISSSAEITKQASQLKNKSAESYFMCSSSFLLTVACAFNAVTQSKIWGEVTCEGAFSTLGAAGLGITCCHYCYKTVQDYRSAQKLFALAQKKNQ